ncbi:unnamed protein product [Ixodes pacificus]
MQKKTGPSQNTIKQHWCPRYFGHCFLREAVLMQHSCQIHFDPSTCQMPKLHPCPTHAREMATSDNRRSCYRRTRTFEKGLLIILWARYLHKGHHTPWQDIGMI